MITYDELKNLLFFEAKEHFEKNPAEFADCEESAIHIVATYVDLTDLTVLPSRLKLPVAMLISYFQYLRANKSDEDSNRKYEGVFAKAIEMLNEKNVPVSTLAEMEGLIP